MNVGEKMTNFEKIKAMNIEEIATEMSYLGCDVCPLNGECFEKYPDMLCAEKIQKRLESEVE